jgi:hypothetical protein
MFQMSFLGKQFRATKSFDTIFMGYDPDPDLCHFEKSDLDLQHWYKVERK